jgi:hypothetical protein
MSCSQTSTSKATFRRVELARSAVKLKPGLRVLYTTGCVITDGMRARFVPGCAVLDKPYTVDELRTSLSNHFQIDPLRADRA